MKTNLAKGESKIALITWDSYRYTVSVLADLKGYLEYKCEPFVVHSYLLPLYQYLPSASKDLKSCCWNGFLGCWAFCRMRFIYLFILTVSNSQTHLLYSHTHLCIKDHLSILFVFLVLVLCVSTRQGKLGSVF